MHRRDVRIPRRSSFEETTRPRLEFWRLFVVNGASNSADGRTTDPQVPILGKATNTRTCPRSCPLADGSILHETFNGTKQAKFFIQVENGSRRKKVRHDDP